MRGSRARRTRPTDSGMVTAEAALALPVLVLVAVFAVAVVLAAAQRVQVVDAAHVAALSAARDDPGVAALVERIAPGARLSLVGNADTVTVTVTRGIDLGPLPGPVARAVAVAPREPGSADAAPP